jgi:adenylate cyclase class 2
MPNQNKELEVKFYIVNMEMVGNYIKSSGGVLVQPRTHEYNLLFDTLGGRLHQNRQILRLRQDIDCYLTFKGPGFSKEGVYARKEVEISVSDFDLAKAFLEALDYEVTMIYEKYRTKYDFDEVQVTIDEMPIGDFIEVEGPDGDKIRTVSKQLGLSWGKRILDSYDTLFLAVCDSLGMGIADMTFANFQGISVKSGFMGVDPADV